jgi:hypothetical protein
MLENSLSDGVLYRFRDPETSSGDVESMLGVLKAYWAAAAAMRGSRLRHGGKSALNGRHKGSSADGRDYRLLSN